MALPCGSMGACHCLIITRFHHSSPVWCMGEILLHRLHRAECTSGQSTPYRRPVSLFTGHASKTGWSCCPCYLGMIFQILPLIRYPDTYVTTSCISFFFLW